MKNDKLNENNPLKLVDLKFICENTGLSRAYIYKLMSNDLFPKPLKLGRASRWYLSEFKDWMGSRHRM
ncbi:helix-turn-helix transcriptional regulator [Lonsdalea quercina]|uniref:helix-turn-helix transcriptional regulator n=1 Tax=Lonsdalea quercina TaxID=71657 RepID=UPI003976C86C